MSSITLVDVAGKVWSLTNTGSIWHAFRIDADGRPVAICRKTIRPRDYTAAHGTFKTLDETYGRALTSRCDNCRGKLETLELEAVKASVDSQFPLVAALTAESGLTPAHPSCLADDAPAAPHALVLGCVDTPDDVDSLRGFALDVAEEFGIPATYATHADFSVTDFTVVVVWGRMADMRNASPLVLAAEALAIGVEVVEAAGATERCPCGQRLSVVQRVTSDGEAACGDCAGIASGCSHCGEWIGWDETATVAVGPTFYRVCRECLTAAQWADPRAEYRAI
ncbi:hypothetical protein [Streptomyces sp. NBC_01429]|uniref:hypothetical protein n=1 Tax=Streptomyces sp. NBC_01429 TaxID=2903862 RepID=UPI002E2CDA3D|nr:hypothetical protein [Streptomyces sp. NBC_01429]